MRRRDEDAEPQLVEALAIVEAAIAHAVTKGGRAPRRAALPRTLGPDVARRLESALRARGFTGARYRDDPSAWDLWDRLETMLGLEQDEPRVEWDEVAVKPDEKQGR